MSRQSPSHQKRNWIILLTLIAICFGVTVTIWLTQEEFPDGIISDTSTPRYTPSIGSPTDEPTPKIELTNESTPVDLTPSNEPPIGSIPDDMTSQMTYVVVNTYPHDPQAFTQGLLIHEGYFYESTGLYGQSNLRKVEIYTGEVLQQSDLPSEYFGEGLTIWENTLIQLTWRENVGFVYDLQDFSLIYEFTYLTEGWGLTHDEAHLIQSDGTSTLSFLDPDTFQVTDQVTVTYQGAEIDQLNELEYIQGEVYANIWQTEDIVRIDPQTGVVLGWIDLTGILPADSITTDTNVLNGIAYDEETNRLFITGKKWPTVFEIRLIPKP